MSTGPKLTPPNKSSVTAIVNMTFDYTAIIDSPIGALGVLVQEQQLRRLDYVNQRRTRHVSNCAITQRVIAQLEQYFSNPHYCFQLPCELSGTTLQQAIWRALQDIPVGTTQSYGEMAKQFDTSPRVIGNACRRNPIPIIYPCHRVTAKHGPGGYSGKTAGRALEMKHWLLRHEAKHQEQRVQTCEALSDPL